ncbi:ankyrin-2 [Cladorrhinum sp. PSN332]|nr:ankyrin-2 [Cladorrhinum sp. PSN332]
MDSASISSDSDSSAASSRAGSPEPPQSGLDAQPRGATPGSSPPQISTGAEVKGSSDSLEGNSTSIEDQVQLQESGQIHVTWSNPSHQFDEPGDPPEVAFDFVIVPGIAGNWEAASPWIPNYIERPDEDDRSRILRFQYSSKGFFSGPRCGDSIRNLAVQLLDGILTSRRGVARKRIIVFVAHDLGGLIVKDALVAAALDPRSFAEISDMCRILIFTGCPHRSTSLQDMEDRLSQFLFSPSIQAQVRGYIPALSSISDLATTARRVNGVFIDSKQLLRSRTFSIHAGPDSGTHLGPAFDKYCGTLGIPFEVRILDDAKPDSYPNLLEQLDDLRSGEFNVELTQRLFLRERTMLALASPIGPFKTAASLDAKVLAGSEYQTWLRLPGPQVLHIHGLYGIREASEQVFFALDSDDQLRMSNTIVLYFSFDQWDAGRDSIRDMAVTFIAQMICQLPRETNSWAETFFTQLSNEKGWTEADLIYWLERIRLIYYMKAGQVVYVLNHFDQCAKDSREIFMDRFKTLAGGSERQYKIVLTSLHPDNLASQLSGAPITVLNLSTLEVTSPPTARKATFLEDNEKFLMRARPELYFHASLVHKELQGIVNVDPLVQHILCHQAVVQPQWPENMSFREMVSQDANLDMPSGNWDDTRIASLLERILSMAGSHLKATNQILLSWILYAVRPLTVWELGNVLYLSQDNPLGGEHPPPTPRVLEDLVQGPLQSLAGLVQVDHNKITLASPRIRDILIGCRKKTGEISPFILDDDVHHSAHYNIARLCLVYLSSQAARERTDQVFKLSEEFQGHIPIQREDLCNYALQAWPHHFQSVSLVHHRKDLELHLKPGTLPGLSARDLARGYWALSNPVTRNPTSLESLSSILSGLGFTNDIFEAPQDATDDWMCTSLLEASSNGQINTVNRLLQQGKFKFSETTLLDALVRAGGSGDEQLSLDLIEEIITSSANQSMVAWPAGLLRRSAWLGLHRLTEKLLQLGVGPDPDVPWVSGSDASPLTQAVCNNHVTTTEVLLRYGADPKLFHDSFGRTLLHLAVRFGNVGVSKVLVQQGNAYLEAQHIYGETPVFSAAAWGNYGALGELLGLGADPNTGLNSESPLGIWSPIVVAANRGFQHCTELLLKYKANPNLPGPSGTAIRHAAINGHVELCRLLLQSGANPNSPLIEPPLIVQVVERLQEKQELCWEIAKLLIDYHFDVNAEDSEGTPPLMHILDLDDVQLVGPVCELLLDNGADINQTDRDGQSPLIEVATNTGNPGLLKLLLDRGAKVDLLAGDGTTALFRALASPECVRLLLERGADISLGSLFGQNGLTTLMQAACGWDEVPLDSLKLLLEHNPPLETVILTPGCDITGATALICALIIGSAAAVRALVEAGANLQHAMESDDGAFPLRIAAGQESQEKLDILLEFLPRLNLNQADNIGRTSIHHPNVPLAHLNRLLNIGVDPNIQDQLGCTPLHYYLLDQSLEHAKSLLRHNADPNILSPIFGGPLHRAAENCELDLVKLLVENGADLNAAAPSKKGTPLVGACLASKGTTSRELSIADMIRYLLGQGASANTPGGLLGYPINAAVMMSSLAIVDLLMGEGSARIDLVDNVGRCTIHFAAYGGNLEIFRRILETGGDIRSIDMLGRTVLQWAVQRGRAEVVEEILERFYRPGGEDINAADKDGWTALCWAARGPHGWAGFYDASESAASSNGLVNVTRLLLDGGARKDVEVKVRGNKWTPEIIARYHGAASEVIEMLALRVGVHDEEIEVLNKQKPARTIKWTCDVCHCQIYGFIYHCKTCGDYDLCFKCYPHRALVHQPKDHQFEEMGPEFEMNEEKSRDTKGDGDDKDKGDTSSSESTTDSDSDSD